MSNTGDVHAPGGGRLDPGSSDSVNDLGRETDLPQPTRLQRFADFFFRTLVIVAAAAALTAIGAFIAAIAQEYTWRQFIATFHNRDGVLYVASWIVLLAISTLATHQVRELIRQSAHNAFKARANVIAVIIGLVLVIVLFKQPFLEQVFAKRTASGLLQSILIGGGITSGWLVWYLRQLSRYGEFFHVLLFTIIVGFCWYARLTAPEQVQTTAVAFLLGSLGRLAKDYLDKAAVAAEG